MAMQPRRNWMITGVSSGFGRLLAEAALKEGDSVVGTLRRSDQVEAFEALAPGRAHAILVDLLDRPGIAAAVAEAVDRLDGRLDILVNNAGYGLMGVLEEVSDEQIVAVIETNLHGTIFMTKAALPHLRESRGMVLNFSSMAGYIGVPGLGAYCAAKFGVEGFTEALRGELAPFGVTVILVEPGAFRTNFSAGSLHTARNPMAIYDDTPGGLTRTAMATYAGHEPGDPARAIGVILDALSLRTPPFRILLGSDAVGAMRGKLATLEAELEASAGAAQQTDFVPAQSMAPV